MADDAIIFGLANPNPEVHPEVAHRHARVVATGRSDFPNQINNVLAFPGIFRGAFDVHATAITEGMKLAAAEALAGLVGDDLAEDLIIPSPFDPRVGPAVVAARRRRRRRAGATGVATALHDCRRSLGVVGRMFAVYADSFSHRRPAVRPGGGGAARARGRPTAGRRSRSRPPRSTTTTSGRCAASGCARRRCR